MGSPTRSPFAWALLAVPLMLSGCMGAGAPAATPAEAAPPAAQEGANRAPAAALDVDSPMGEVPFAVTFTVLGNDVDRDNLTWYIDVDGDQASEESGHGLPGTYRHVFDQPGDYHVRATVTDGAAEAEAYARVVAHAPSIENHPLDPLTFTGTITGAWAGEYVPEPDVHAFPLPVVPNEIRAHIEVGATAVDLDYVLRTPTGEWAAGEANPNEPTGLVQPKTESDLIVDDPRHLAQLGEWTLEVWAGGSVEGEYTVTVSFG